MGNKSREHLDGEKEDCLQENNNVILKTALNFQGKLGSFVRTGRVLYLERARKFSTPEKPVPVDFFLQRQKTLPLSWCILCCPLHQAIAPWHIGYVMMHNQLLQNEISELPLQDMA